MSLTNDAADPVGSYLIAPDGAAVGFGQNRPDHGIHLAHRVHAEPGAGTWTLIVDFAEPIVGDELADPYSGSVTFNTSSASAAGLPDSRHTVLAAGTPVTVPVTVTNNGSEPEDFFIDPRLNSYTTLQLGR